jgi:hypothetical protein
LAMVVIGGVDCHERRLKSVIGVVILLEYIYNLAEETVEINIETFVLVSADRYQQFREVYLLSSIREFYLPHEVTKNMNYNCHHFFLDRRTLSLCNQPARALRD